MSTKIPSHLKQQNWRLLYYRYQNSPVLVLGTTGVVILICTIIFITVIIPQFKTYLSIKQEITRTEQQIDTVRANTQLISQLNDSTVDDQFRIANEALPSTNDFTAIINVVSATSQRTGVAVNDFTFSLASNSTGKIGTKGSGQSVDLELSLNGSVTSVKQFVEEIQKKLPIADVKDVSGGNDKATVDVSLYYKSFPQISYNDTEPLQTVSGANANLLSTLSDWEQTSIPLDDAGQSASSAAVPLSPF